MTFQKNNKFGGAKPKEIIFDITEEGCHICTSHCKNPDGYITKWNPKTKKVDKLHRMIYEELNGEIPIKMEVCHTCDNPSCINPDHLFLGTHQENMNDKVSKNRQSRLPGENNPISKLSELEVREILNSPTEKLTKLAKKYNVSFALIEAIRQNRAWKHIDRDIREAQ